MDFITVNSQCVPIQGEKNVLSLIRKAGIELPTFCYHSDLSIYGACRMCVVEDERGRVFASCSEQPRAGMVIKTNTTKLQNYRKLIMELLLAAHCRDCTTCQKNGICALQRLAYQLGVDAVRFTNHKERVPLDTSSPSIVRDPNKCILCGDCVRTCAEVQGVGALDFAFRGANMQVMPAFNRDINDTDCVGCGQCRVVCPTAAITIKKDEQRVWDAIHDPNVRVVVQIAPAVRIAIGDSFGIPKGTNAMGKLVTALRRMGVDQVFDTSFGADLTVYEESEELVERLKSGENLPLLTSCCPGWVKYCESRYPELTKHISSCRSPQGMFSAVLKDYYHKQDEETGKRTFVVSIMPCTAKKGEILRDDYHTNGEQDTDASITTAEAARMIHKAAIRFEKLEEQAVDMPFGVSSGGGVIFGVTGGVTEAVLRKICCEADNRQAELSRIEFSGVRGMDSVKEAEVMVGDRKVRIAIVHGLANVQPLMEAIKNGTSQYDFIEVMACSRGCVMGGGQPTGTGLSARAARMRGLYKTDIASQVRVSTENPMIKVVYDDVIKGREHELLHTKHEV